MLTTIKWLISHRNVSVKAICAASVAFFILWGVNTHRQNIKLSQELEMAQNNIEAYQGLLNDSQQANNVLRLDVQKLKDYNDATLQKLDSVRAKLKIKPKQIDIAATQTQVLNVNDSKGVRGDIITILKDTVYSDSIKYNPLTTVKYTIGKDTVSIGLDVRNEQYLYVYSKKEYKNKKSFIARLFTFDFKKTKKYKYELVNTNDLLKSGDVRVVESTSK